MLVRLALFPAHKAMTLQECFHRRAAADCEECQALGLWSITRGANCGTCESSVWSGLGPAATSTALQTVGPQARRTPTPPAPPNPDVAHLFLNWVRVKSCVVKEGLIMFELFHCYQHPLPLGIFRFTTAMGTPTHLILVVHLGL